jgi:hypothetical protein
VERAFAYFVSALGAGVAIAVCNNGHWDGSRIRSDEFPARMPGSDGGLPPFDYGLLNASDRQHAVDRARAFLARISAPAALDTR